MDAAVCFSKGLGGVRKSGAERFNFLLLGIDLLVQHLISCGERLYGIVVFIELGGYQLHLRAEHLEGLVDIRECFLEFLFALKTDF